MEKKLIIVKVETNTPVHTIDAYSSRTMIHSQWTLSNGIVILLSYYKVEYKDDASMCHTYIYISPLFGHYDKTYFEVRDSLKLVKNAAETWGRCRKDGYLCDINYNL
jgi:hypothetical protein